MMESEDIWDTLQENRSPIMSALKYIEAVEL